MKRVSSILPWWSKIGAKILLSRLPFGYSLWQKIGFFRHGAMDTSAYAIGVFDAHVAKAGLSGKLAGKRILELGPGDSIATAIIAAAHGAQAVLVDAGAFVRSDVAPYLEVARVHREKFGSTLPEITSGDRIDSILSRCGAEYHTRGLASLREIKSGSIDLIFSQAVLEHIRRHEFLETMKECRRILKPGGIATHQVDLRDHLGGALNHLRFTEKTWESDLFTGSGFYTNRIQYSQMLELCTQAGFTVVEAPAKRWAALPTPKRKLVPEFSALSDEELGVSVFDVVLR